MAPDWYKITVEPSRKLVVLELFGFWTAETARVFAADVRAAVRRVASRPRQHLVLADLTGFNLQSQAVVAICRALVAEAPVPARRLAVVAGDGLARIQIKRVMVRDGMEVFASRAKATGWLLGDASAAASPAASASASMPPPAARLVRHSRLA